MSLIKVKVKMSELKRLREDVTLLLLFDGPATAQHITEVLDKSEVEILAALFVLKGNGGVCYDDDGYWFIDVNSDVCVDCE